MASLGHPVVGDTLYGAATAIAPGAVAAKQAVGGSLPRLVLPRNFLHAAELEFLHPVTDERLTLVSNLPADLKDFMALLDPARIAAPDTPEG